MSDNVLLYPIIKKLNKKIELNADNEPDIDELEEVSNHLTNQIIQQLQNHDIVIDKAFLVDMGMVKEMILSSIQRTLGIHHPLQDYTDEVMSFELDEDFEPTDEDLEKEQAETE